MRKILVAILLFTLVAPSVPADADGLRCPHRIKFLREAAKGRRVTVKQLDYIMWRESRCRKLAHNPTDPVGGSYGLFQINGYWCTPNSYSRTGWLQSQKILERCTDLYNPAVSVAAFGRIFDYVEERWGDGWIPWKGSSSGTR